MLDEGEVRWVLCTGELLWKTWKLRQLYEAGAILITDSEVYVDKEG